MDAIEDLFNDIAAKTLELQSLIEDGQFDEARELTEEIEKSLNSIKAHINNQTEGE